MTATPERLSAAAHALVERTDMGLYLSAASAWEIAIKYTLGKLPLPEPPSAFVPSRLAQTSVVAVPVDHLHAVHVSTLPPHHHDPFDRILVAQAQLDDFTILTADPVFRLYDVNVIQA